MTTLYLVRHGSTAWNESPRFRGLADIELSETGLAQANNLAKCLKSRPITMVYSSPLRRAMQTAEAIALPRGLEVHAHCGLSSVDYGDWEGRTEQEAQQLAPDLYATFLAAIETLRFPGGESMDELRNRASAALQEIASAHAGQHVVVVTHQVVTRVLICVVLGIDSKPYWRIGQDPACLNVIEYRNRFRLKMMNYLPDDPWPTL
jgi:broad specificity phosphatase PhoE